MHFNFKMHILNFANFDRYLSKVVVSVYSYTKILQSVASLYPGQHRVSSDILANGYPVPIIAVLAFKISWISLSKILSLLYES